MESPSLIALSRQMTIQRQMDMVANNLANANTTGFKAESPLIIKKEMPVLSQNFKQHAPLAMVMDYGMVRDTRAGELNTTNNPLDVALQSDGYFAVDTGNGTSYTRAGSFQLNADSELVDHNGFRVQGDGGPITIPPDAQQITINKDGSIATENGIVGRLGIFKFADDQALKPAGNGLLQTEQTAETVDAADVKVTQGALENSNVQTVGEMTNMIDLLRQYQSVQKLMDNEQDRERQSISRIAKMN